MPGVPVVLMSKSITVSVEVQRKEKRSEQAEKRRGENAEKGNEKRNEGAGRRVREKLRKVAVKGRQEILWKGFKYPKSK